MVAQTVLDDVGRILFYDKVEPLLGSLILLLNNALVAIVLVELELGLRMSHGPPHTTILNTDRRGRIGEHTVCQLAVIPVPHGLGIEIGHVIIKHEGLVGIDQITAIAEAFPMRTIRLHTEDVAEEGPFAHGLNGIEQLIGTGKTPHLLDIGIQPQPSDQVKRGGDRTPGDFDIPKSMKRKPRCIDFRAIAPGKIDILLPRHAWMGFKRIVALALDLTAHAGHRIQSPVFMEQLAVSQIDLSAGLQVEFERGQP